MKDQHCDYLAYAWEPTQSGLVLPFQVLRMAWRQHGREWRVCCEDGNNKQFRVVLAKNPGYTTESYAIPTDVLLDAVRDAMRVEYPDVPPEPPSAQLQLFKF